MNRRSLIAWTVIAGTYLSFTLWMYHQWGLIPRNTIIGSASGDTVQQVWFLAWPAYALAHGHSPFVSDWLNYPHGVNLMVNTAALIVGIVAAPITWIFGPLATYAWMLRLSIFATALSGAGVLRRLGFSYPAVFIGGAVWGFNASRLVRGDIHVFLALQVCTPLIIYAFVQVIAGRWSRRRGSVLLAVLMSVNFMISPETAFLDALGLLIAFMSWWIMMHRSRENLRRVLRTGVTAAAGAGVLLSYPLWMFLAGPQHIKGVVHPFVSDYSVAWSSIMQPSPANWLAPLGRSGGIGFFNDPQHVWVNPAYIGIIVLIVACAGIWIRRKDRSTWVVVSVAVVGLILALGPETNIPFTSITVPMPYALVSHVPLAQSALPVRFERYVFIACAYFVAVVVQYLYEQRRVWWRPLAMAAVGGAIVVSLVPQMTYSVQPTYSPEWLSSTEARRVLPDGAVVLSYPYPVVLWDSPMLDQASSGMHYKLIGGQAIVPDDHGRNHGIAPLKPYAVIDLFWYGMWGADRSGFPYQIGGLPPNTEATARGLRRFVADNHVDALVFKPWGLNWQVVLPYLERAFGPPQSRDNGSVQFWRFDRTSPLR